jgi:hypothetical protein
MAPIPDHVKSGNRKCHHTIWLFISLLKCSAIHGIGEKLYLNPKTFLSSLTKSIGNSPVYSRFGSKILAPYNSNHKYIRLKAIIIIQHREILFGQVMPIIYERRRLKWVE